MKNRKYLLLFYCVLLCGILCMAVVIWSAFAGRKTETGAGAEEGTFTTKIEIIPEEKKVESLEEQIRKGIPLFYQWQEPWGTFVYGAGPMAVTGCGPTCLSMVAMYLLQDIRLTPQWMAEFSIDNGFCVPGSGTSWLLMSEGAQMLGISSEELMPTKQQIEEKLSAGYPVICIMGPGDFTDKGHFIVLTGMEDGMIRIHDSNSVENSEKLWTFEEIESQIRNLWAFSRM